MEKDMNANSETVVNEKEHLGLATELLRSEKSEKKGLVKAVIALSVSFAVTVLGIVIAFLIFLYQYDYGSYQVESQDGGNASFIGRDGEILNGTNQSEIADTEGR